MISNQRKCLAPDRGNVTDPNGIPDCQRFGHQPPLHRMENGMDADDALNLLRGPQISLPSSIRPTNTILYFSPSIGCKCNSNGWKFVGSGKRSMHPKKKWREGKIVKLLNIIRSLQSIVSTIDLYQMYETQEFSDISPRRNQFQCYHLMLPFLE